MGLSSETPYQPKIKNLSIFGVFYAGKSDVRIVNNSGPTADLGITLLYIGGPAIPPDANPTRIVDVGPITIEQLYRNTCDKSCHWKCHVVGSWLEYGWMGPLERSHRLHRQRKCSQVLHL